MVYPLNALINSQQERLSAYLSPFKGLLRFCLYNALTEETVPKSTRRKHRSLCSITKRCARARRSAVVPTYHAE